MRLRAFALFGLAILIALTVFPRQAQAAKLTVTRTGDSSWVAPAPAATSTPVLAIRNIRGIAGEVVAVDVVFSNPTGSGFSGIGMGMTVEDPGIAEFADVRLPDWIDPFFAGFLMDSVIAPDGFPTSSINLVVPDLLQQVEGVVTNEVLATISLRLIDTGKTRLLLGLFQLDDDDPSGPTQGDLIPITNAPTSVATTVAVCALDLELGYRNSALTMAFNLGTAKPAVWNIWLFVFEQVIPLWSAPVPVVVPPVSFDVAMPLPSVGKVWLLASLTTADGATCFTFDTTDTGSPPSSTPSIEGLRKLFPTPSITLPGN